MEKTQDFPPSKGGRGDVKGVRISKSIFFVRFTFLHPPLSPFKGGLWATQRQKVLRLTGIRRTGRRKRDCFSRPSGIAMTEICFPVESITSVLKVRLRIKHVENAVYPPRLPGACGFAGVFSPSVNDAAGEFTIHWSETGLICHPKRWHIMLPPLVKNEFLFSKLGFPSLNKSLKPREKI